MANPQLTDEQQLIAKQILVNVRDQLLANSNGDGDLLFALRRKVQKELMHDERGNATHRNRIKKAKRAEQNDLCPICEVPLPEKDCILDRFEAKLGYTIENTRLIHMECDRAEQAKKNYA
ncbi:hypothetical protein SPAN111604_00665 [Sphingomonas antarctica]|uniref:hypothetical protein n=1 Tax=Sphingomonas antarctica TaxID=2040274 RepID=UPI0039EC9B0B